MSSENQKLSSFTQSITADSSGNTQTVSAPRLEATVSANLGNVSNLTITGGTSGQVLVTNGAGGLSWANANSTVTTQAQPMLEFVVDSSGNNKTFTHPYIESFVNNSYCEIFLNGVLQRIQDYTISGNLLTVNTYLNTDDVITVGITGIFDMTGNTGNANGVPTVPGGISSSVQFNNNGTFDGSTNFTYNAGIVSVPTLDINGTTTAQSIIPASNVTYDLGSSNLRWRSAYFAPNNVYVGSQAIGDNGNALTVGGNPVVVAPNNTITIGNVVANTISGTFIGDGSNLTNLPVANIAYIPLDGNTNHFLRGDGVFALPPGGGGGSGTVTSVSGNGTGLGFSLSGTVTTSGNITLTAPNATSLRTSLNIGNIANLNLDGNVSNVLAGDGTWIAKPASSGNVSEVQLSDGSGGFTGGNRLYVDTTNNRLIVSNDQVAPIAVVRYGTAGAGIVAYRSRGTKAAPQAVQVNDSIMAYSGFAYTGNGSLSIDGVTGWANSWTINGQIQDLPANSGGAPNTVVSIQATNTGANTTPQYVASFYGSNLTSVFSNVVINGNLQATNATVTTTLIVNAGGAPTNSTDPGVQGQIEWDGSYIYVCIATNTWVRSPLATW